MQNSIAIDRNSMRALGATLMATLLSGSAAFAAATLTGTAGTHASAIAMSQKVRDNAVSITYAYLPKAGTLDIYSVNSAGKIGAAPLGKVSLSAGDHRDIKVHLNSEPKEGTRLQAVLEAAGQPFKNSGDAPERTFKVL